MPERLLQTLVGPRLCRRLGMRDAGGGAPGMPGSAIRSPRLRVTAAVLSLWGASFCLSCWTSPGAVSGESGAGGSLLGAFLGESREVLGEQFSAAADDYFHMGAERIRPVAFDNGVFQRIGDEISPRGHVHLSGRDLEEIMPWLWLALRANPRNVETCLVTAFWLSHGLGRSDLAHRVLAEARWNNPFNYEVQLEEARLYLKEGDPDEACRALEAGLAFWPGRQDPAGPDARYGRATLLFYRALLHEARREREAAIRLFGEVMELYPERGAIQKRIDALRRDERPAVEASAVWQRMLKTEEESRAQDHCDRGPGHESH